MTAKTLPYNSPVGALFLICEDGSLTGSGWTEPGPEVARDDGSDEVLAAASRQLDEYFAGERTDFDLPLRPQGTAFQQSAWEQLRRIPFGETISYGEQARRVGDPGKARAVGAANARNPLPVIVGCHRVVAADGALTGFAGGVDRKRWLLEHEQRVLAP